MRLALWFHDYISVLTVSPIDAHEQISDRRSSGPRPMSIRLMGGGAGRDRLADISWSFRLFHGLSRCRVLGGNQNRKIDLRMTLDSEVLIDGL